MLFGALLQRGGDGGRVELWCRWAPVSGETVSLDGGVTQRSYAFLGYDNVRGDPLQYAAFIRIEMGDGSFLTMAIDMNNDGDQLPNLQTGNTKLKVSDLDTATANKFPAPACFTPGTEIETPDGPVAIEWLRPGDLVVTRDDGVMPLRAVRTRRVPALGSHAPVRFEPDAIGNTQPLLVSQAHGMVISDWRSAYLFGFDSVLVSARSLLNGSDVRLINGGIVTYIHLLFDRHVLVRAEGVWSESFQLSAGRKATLDAPEFTQALPGVDQIAALPRIKGKEARLLPALAA